MNVHILSLKIGESFMQLHGIRSWKKAVLPRLAVITEEAPSALQSALHAMVSLLENGDL